MASGFYVNGLKKWMDRTVDPTGFKLMLVDTSYTFNADHEFVDNGENDATDPSFNEIVATNYTGGFEGAGRLAAALTYLANKTDNRVDIQLDDETWEDLGGDTNDTIGGVILIYEDTDDTASSLIAFFDTTNTPTNGGDITLDYLLAASGGNLRVAVTAGWYVTGLKEWLDGTIDPDDLKAVLVDDNYTYDADHDVFDNGNDDASDPSANEVIATNYTGGFEGAGRKATTLTYVANTTDDRVDIAIDDLTWSAIGGASNDTVAQVLFVVESGVADTTTRLVARLDVPDRSTNGGNIAIDFAASGSGGNLQITCTAA